MSVATLILEAEQGEIKTDSEIEFEKLLKELGDSKWDYKTKTITRSIIPVAASVESGRMFHQNYIFYLTRCWANHLGVVIEPNHIWYTLMCELASRVKDDPETYRSIFTDSDENKNIIVPCDGGGFIISMELLINELKKKVPSDVDAFLPQFSTTTMRSRTASHAAFADMASPYYNYFMLACGFPAIDVRGELNDWKLMADQWKSLTSIFQPLNGWFSRVQKILDDCVTNIQNKEWWTSMYTSKRCGSGGETKIDGWFSNLFYEKCDFPKPGNFPPCVATVDYTYMHDKNVTNYKMKHGILFSREQDEFLVPEFGFVLFNELDEPETVTPDMREHDWIAKMEPGNHRNSKSYVQ